MQQKRRLSRIIDLDIRRSMGAISSIEYKRRRILYEINHMTHAIHKISKYPYFLNNFMNGFLVNITSMEVDPREHRWYVIYIKLK